MTKAQMMEVVCKSVPMDALAKQEMLKQSKDYVSGYYNAIQAVTHGLTAAFLHAKEVERGN